MLAGGRVRVNGATARNADTALAAGDVVELAVRGPRRALPPGLDLVHEDDDLIVVDKPAGLLTIATERERQRTVYAYLTARARTRKPPARVFVVHRLDRRASGLLVFARSPVAKRMLQAQFAAHTVERTYLAVVEGRLARPAGTVASRLLDDAPGRVRQTRDPRRGRPAVTHWRVVRAATRSTLLEVRLETGPRNRHNRACDRRSVQVDQESLTSEPAPDEQLTAIAGAPELAADVPAREPDAPVPDAAEQRWSR